MRICRHLNELCQVLLLSLQRVHRILKLHVEVPLLVLQPIVGSGGMTDEGAEGRGGEGEGGMTQLAGCGGEEVRDLEMIWS